MRKLVIKSSELWGTVNQLTRELTHVGNKVHFWQRGISHPSAFQLFPRSIVAGWLHCTKREYSVAFLIHYMYYNLMYIHGAKIYLFFWLICSFTVMFETNFLSTLLTNIRNPFEICFWVLTSAFTLLFLSCLFFVYLFDL